MKEQKIDKLFQSKLGEYGTPPPPQVWGNIQASVAGAKKKKAILFWRIAGVAAVLAIAIISAVMLSDSNNEQPKLTENQNNPVIQNNVEKPIENINTKTIEPIIAEEDLLASKAMEKNKTFWKPKTNLNINKEETFQKENKLTNIKRDLLAQYDYLKSRGQAILPEGNGLFEKIRDNRKPSSAITILESERKIIAMNAKNLTRDKENLSRWKVGVLLSPEYSSQNTSHSEAYRNDMTAQASTGNTNIGGGFSVKYKTSKKWSIESGVYYSKNGQKSGNSGSLFSSNAEYSMAENSNKYSTAVEVDQGNLLLNSTAGVIQIADPPSEARLYTNLDASANNSVVLLSSGEYYQAFDFVEVPVYLRYQLIESKIGVQLMGGISTNFLIGNNVYIEDGGVSQKVGKTENISTINYSGTLGIGLEYALGKKLSLTFEPRVNYYLSSINKSSDVDYRPYRIGVYTGLNYTF